MTSSNSTARTRKTSIPAYTRKPAKPAASFADPKEPFPLTINPCGYYSKKIKGHVYYFGRWDQGPEAAEQEYRRQREDLEAGRDPNAEPLPGAGLRIGGKGGLLNEYRACKERAMEEGEISARTYLDVIRTCDFLAKHLHRDRLVSDLKPSDFLKIKAALRNQKRQRSAKSLVVLGNWIIRIKSVFKYAVDELKAQPIHFGVEFKKPKAERVQEQKQAKVEEEGERTFTREEILAMLAAADQPMKAFILLAINAGLGNSDLGQMRFAHLDLDGRWLNYPRPKTKRPRKCYLWSETVASIRDWLTQRPEPQEPGSKLVFLTQRGLPWHKGTFDSPLSHEFRKLLDSLKINGGRGFYNLRATYRTEAGPCRDVEALYGTMGHKLPGMASEYVHQIQPDRLQLVAETVHRWLFAEREPSRGGGSRKKGKK